jgi:hypothetical protein
MMMKKRKSSAIKSKALRESSLQSLRNIGPSIESKLQLIGVNTVADFMKADPLELYNRLESKLGFHVDRCVLYCFKGAQLDLPWPACKRFFQIDNSNKSIRARQVKL